MIGFGGDPGFGVTFSIMQIMVPVMFVLVFGIAKFLQSQLGGLTGDTYGALTECGNVLYLLTLIIGGRFLVLGFYTYHSIFSLF